MNLSLQMDDLASKVAAFRLLFNDMSEIGKFQSPTKTIWYERMVRLAIQSPELHSILHHVRQ